MVLDHVRKIAHSDAHRNIISGRELDSLELSRLAFIRVDVLNIEPTHKIVMKELYEGFYKDYITTSNS
jgi:hypothetical protein